MTNLKKKLMLSGETDEALWFQHGIETKLGINIS